MTKFKNLRIIHNRNDSSSTVAQPTALVAKQQPMKTRTQLDSVDYGHLAAQTSTTQAQQQQLSSPAQRERSRSVGAVERCLMRGLKSGRHCYHHYGIKYAVLLAVFAIYIVIGGIIFFILETDTDRQHRQHWRSSLQANRTRFIRHDIFQVIFNNSPHLLFLSPEETRDIESVFNARLLQYEQLIGVRYQQQQYEWTLLNSLLYACTIITTIGYGHLHPVTMSGQIASMIYLVLGLPLTMLVVRQLSHWFIVILNQPRRLCKACWRCLKFCAHRSVEDIRVLAMHEKKQQSPSHALQHSALTSTNIATQPPAAAQLANPTSSSITQSTQISSHPITITSIADKSAMAAEDDTHNVMNISVLLMFLVLVGYLFAGALIFRVNNPEWSLTNGFYFCFNSLSTVGVGDYTPADSRLFLGMFVYIVLGLGLVSTFIELLYAKFVRAYRLPSGLTMTINGCQQLLHPHHAARARRHWDDTTYGIASIREEVDNFADDSSTTGPSDPMQSQRHDLSDNVTTVGLWQLQRSPEQLRYESTPANVSLLRRTQYFRAGYQPVPMSSPAAHSGIVDDRYAAGSRHSDTHPMPPPTPQHTAASNRKRLPNTSDDVIIVTTSSDNVTQNIADHPSRRP